MRAGQCASTRYRDGQPRVSLGAWHRIPFLPNMFGREWRALATGVAAGLGVRLHHPQLPARRRVPTVRRGPTAPHTRRRHHPRTRPMRSSRRRRHRPLPNQMPRRPDRRTRHLVRRRPPRHARPADRRHCHRYRNPASASTGRAAAAHQRPRRYPRDRRPGIGLRHATGPRHRHSGRPTRCALRSWPAARPRLCTCQRRREARAGGPGPGRSRCRRGSGRTSSTRSPRHRFRLGTSCAGWSPRRGSADWPSTQQISGGARTSLLCSPEPNSPP